MYYKPEKRICKNPNHPFKQKWYNYNSTIDDPDFCSSCKHALNIVRNILGSVIVSMRKQETLYGEKYIEISDSQFLKIFKEELRDS